MGRGSSELKKHRKKKKIEISSINCCDENSFVMCTYPPGSAESTQDCGIVQISLIWSWNARRNAKLRFYWFAKYGEGTGILWWRRVWAVGDMTVEKHVRKITLEKKSESIEWFSNFLHKMDHRKKWMKYPKFFLSRVQNKNRQFLFFMMRTTLIKWISVIRITADTLAIFLVNYYRIKI